MFCIEIYMFIIQYPFFCFRVDIQKSFDRFVVFDVAFINFFNIFFFNFHISYMFIGNHDKNTLFTKTMTSCRAGVRSWKKREVFDQT